MKMKYSDLIEFNSATTCYLCGAGILKKGKIEKSEIMITELGNTEVLLIVVVILIIFLIDTYLLFFIIYEDMIATLFLKMLMIYKKTTI
jgi:hypothetical protein